MKLPRKWPGLFHFCEGAFRSIGYALFVGAGYAMAMRESFVLVIVLIVLGHIWVVVAEVVSDTGHRQRNAKEPQ